MTFDQLEVLEMIVEKGSFKAAAKHLHRTQPTLSVSIKKLEAEFDVQLFSREEYRPKLTDEGRVFYERAKQTLRSFRALNATGKELGMTKAEPSLTVIVDPVAHFDSIKTMFDQCLNDMRSTDLIIRSEIVERGMQLVVEGEVDFAITPLTANVAGEIEAYPLEQVRMMPVVASSLLAKASIDLEWLREHPQIIVSSSTGTPTLGSLDGGKRCYVSDHALKRRMIIEGLGWGRLASHEIEGPLKKGSLQRVSARHAKGFDLDLHVMRSTKKPMGPVARAVWKQLSGAS